MDYIMKRKEEAYKPTVLDSVYTLVVNKGVVPEETLKTVDTEILRCTKELHEQIISDGIKHARVKVGKNEGLIDDVLGENARRVLAFCAIVIRTTQGIRTEDLFELYGFGHKEELVMQVQELCTTEKDPHLIFGHYTPVRLLVRKMSEANAKKMKK